MKNEFENSAIGQALEKSTVLTGVRPTGAPHVGNYIGAIRPTIELAGQAKKSFVFIADLHALNSVRSGKDIHRHTLDVAASFLALGLNPEKTVLFRQSDVPEVLYLTNLLANITPKGLIERGHAYKTKVLENGGEAADDENVNINMGLFGYPVMMAADILLYGANLVPVGQDQKQHVEMARDIANKFNRIYGNDVLVAPNAHIQEVANALPGLDGRKMSKSYGNVIPVFEDGANLQKLIAKIKTDSARPEDPKNPDESTIFQLYQSFASPESVEEMRAKFTTGGMGYGDAKKLLFDAMDAYLTGPRERYRSYMESPEHIERILQDGAARARDAAQPVFKSITKAMFGRSINLAASHMASAPSMEFTA